MLTKNAFQMKPIPGSRKNYGSLKLPAAHIAKSIKSKKDQNYSINHLQIAYLYVKRETYCKNVDKKKFQPTTTGLEPATSVLQV
jgi:hypothetical protein